MERVMVEGYISPDDSPIVRMTGTEAQDNFDNTINRVASGEERVILSKDGKDIAAVISIEEFWFLERAIEMLENEMDVEDACAALLEAKEKGTISLDKLKVQLGL